MRAQPTPRRCAGCRTAHYLPSLGDPQWCYRCAIWLLPWAPAPFGKVRKVPRVIAAHWS